MARWHRVSAILLLIFAGCSSHPVDRPNGIASGDEDARPSPDGLRDASVEDRSLDETGSSPAFDAGLGSPAFDARDIGPPLDASAASLGDGAASAESGTDATTGPPRCPPSASGPCTVPQQACIYDDLRGGRLTCTCRPPPGGSALSWECIQTIPPQPPQVPSPDASLTAADGGFTRSCTDCVRADLCIRQQLPDASTSLTEQCVQAQVIGADLQTILSCQAYISAMQCP